MNAVASQHLFRYCETIYKSRGLFFFSWLTFNFNLLQSAFDNRSEKRSFQITSLLLTHVITRFCYPQMWIFYQIWTTFQSQGTAIWQKIDKKFKCRTFARTPLSAGLNIDTYMTLLLLPFISLSPMTCLWTVPLTRAMCYFTFKIFVLFRANIFYVLITDQ